MEGATVIDVCQFGDARLMEETAKVFKKDKEMKKGTSMIHIQIHSFINCHQTLEFRL